MSRPEKWQEMVNYSRDAIEDFNDFKYDKAIVWANHELENYKRAMLILHSANSGWAMNVTDEDEAFVNTMIRRAQAC